MSIGVVLILPIGNITEYIFSNTTFNVWYYAGMSIIILAFGFYTYGEYRILVTNENEQEEDKGLFGRIKEVAGFRDAPKVEKEIILFERFE